MTWKQQLRPASFRGVRFLVRDRTFKTGRDTFNHEYPKRNTNFAEDMGRDTREYTVDAYVIGDDYMSRRDALISACEKPGPGTYVDKWGRSLQVQVQKGGCEVKETDDEGRLARITLRFIDAGSSAMPTAIAATAANLAGAAAGLAGVAALNFARLGIVAQLPASISTAARLPISALPAAIAIRTVGTVLRR